jgi:hypothetical protein
MNSLSGAGGGNGGFGKMLVVLPVMLAARKLDSKNEDQVRYVRLAYGVVQSLCFVVVLYAYYIATKVSSTRSIYVPPAASVRFVFVMM